MALFNDKGRLSRKAFEKAPGIANLDDIEPSASSLEGSEASSDYYIEPYLPRSEPCLVTGSILSTNRPVYWIRPKYNQAARHDTQHHIRNLRICGVNFLLHSHANVSNLDCFVHESLETYAFIAVTGTHETLLQLRELLEKDCEDRQAYFDKTGTDPDRTISYADPALQNAKYELVVLHPEHFLPVGVFTMFDKSAGIFKMYVPSSDRRLREMPGALSCPPPSSISPPDRGDMYLLSPFLVVLNAQVKFRRYKRLVERSPPAKSLPDDVIALMDLTASLVDLIYWEPEVKEDTPGGKIAIARRGKGYSRWYPHEVVGSPVVPWPDDADLETRIAMGSELLFGDDPWYSGRETDDSVHRNPGEDKPDSLEKVRNWQNGANVAGN